MAPPGYPNLNVNISYHVQEWMNAHPNDLITTQFGSVIYTRDLRCLRIEESGVNPLELGLTDQIVNQYLDLVCHHTNESSETMMHTLPLHFWETLRDMDTCGRN